MADFQCADLYDEHGDALQVLEIQLLSFGLHARFQGPISTCKVYEDNTLVRAALEEAGDGRILVVDGGASLRCALVGDKLAELGVDNGWAGIVVSGCIRDSAAIKSMQFGIKALGTNPRKSVKAGAGSRDVPVAFGGVRFEPGAYLYADEDGVLVADRALV